MPNHEEHCNDSTKRYGYHFSDIHKWMDEPCSVAGISHRKFRHEPFKTPEEAERIFWDKIPAKYRDYIKHAVLDHIRLDSLSTSEKKGLELEEIKSLPFHSIDPPDKNKPAFLSLVKRKWIDQAFDEINNKSMIYFGTNSREVEIGMKLPMETVYFKLTGTTYISLKADFVELTEKYPIQKYRLEGSYRNYKYFYLYKNLRWLKRGVELVGLKYYLTGINLPVNQRGATIIQDPQVD